MPYYIELCIVSSYVKNTHIYIHTHTTNARSSRIIEIGSILESVPYKKFEIIKIKLKHVT